MKRAKPKIEVSYEVRDRRGQLWADVVDLEAAREAVREFKAEKLRGPFTIWRVTSERVPARRRP